MSDGLVHGEDSSWARQLKDKIRQRYSRLAGAEEFPTGGAARVLAAGYPAEWIADVPDRLLAGYAGCGNPLAELSVTDVERAVDLGSGTGLDAYLLARRLSAAGSVITIDFTTPMLERARAAWPVEARIVPVAGDLEAIPLADCSTDLVIANAAFNLTLDKSRAFAEAARILKPGGRLAIRDLIKDREIPREVLDDPLSAATSLGGVVTEEEMRQALCSAGFAGIEVTDPRPFSYVTSVMVSAVKPR